MSSAREYYRDWSQGEGSVPLFSKGWWLDATCGSDGWDAVVLHEGGRARAALPYRRRSFPFGISLDQPPLTPMLGPWIEQTCSPKMTEQIGNELELLTRLVDSLPPFAEYRQYWSPRFKNWLPFLWAGFSQTTHYTYRIEDLKDLDSIWRGMKGSIRREIRKAEGREGIHIDESGDIDALIKLHTLTFSRQGKRLSYSPEYVRQIASVCMEKGCGKIHVAKDGEGRPHAAVFTVWDADSAYYLLGGGDPGLRTSGATSLAMWEAIKLSSTVTRSFDFEGSILQPVERYFRSFGANLTPCFKVYKTPSRCMRMLRFVRGVLAP